MSRNPSSLGAFRGVFLASFVCFDSRAKHQTRTGCEEFLYKTASRYSILKLFYSLLKHCNQRVLDKVREISVWRLGDYKFRSISLRLCPVASPRIDFIRPRIDHVSTRGLLKRLSVRNFLSNLIIDLPTYFPSSIVVIEL